MSSESGSTRGSHQPNAQSQLFAGSSCSPPGYKDSWIFDMANPGKHSILEIRKEKSRDAARSRRGKENYEFYELAKLLPLPAAITSQLDKASIIRLSISYLKLRDFGSHGDPPWHRDGPPPNKSIKDGSTRRRSLSAIAMDIFETHQGTHILQSIDGFVFALANDGRFLYISETVSIYLGLSQVEMAGSSIFDYVHHQDHMELADQLGLCLPQNSTSVNVPSPGSLSDEGSSLPSGSRSISPSLQDGGYIMNPNLNRSSGRSFSLRMKSTLTKRGVHVKCAGYRVVHVLGQHRSQFSYNMNRKHTTPVLGMVCIGVALPPPTITELRIDNDTFVMRLSPQFKVVYCEPMISQLLDLSAEDLTNNLLYDFCHAADLPRLRKCHVDLLAKGQVLSDYFRLMNRQGGYTWIQTCATTLYNSKSIDDQSIIAINYVLSGVEGDRCIMDSWQLSCVKNANPDQSSDHSDPGDLGAEQGEASPKGKESEHTESDEKTGDQSNTDERLKSPPTQSNSDLLDHNDNSLDMKHGIDHVFSGDSAASLNSRDLKYSRRKMEKPRKRKQEFDIEETFLDKESIPSQTYCDNSFSDLVGRNIEQSMQCVSHSPELMCPPMTSPIPQDLSLKSTTSESLGEGHSDWRRTSSSDHQSMTGVIASSSVKELEAVMNRHLPVISCNHYNTDLSHKSARPVGGQAQKKSTIQWIGSQPATTETLPATNLLRSIYANRESVIRTNTRPGYYTEMPVNMLTPPGSESYKDQSHSFSISSTPVTHKSNGSYNVTSNYSSSPVSLSMTTPIDSYGITPPSSVSPREKLQSPFAETQSYAETSVVSCANISSDPLSSRQVMKQATPHTYQLVAAATSQDYCGAKYGAPSFSSNTVYCDSTANSYEPCSRSVLPWYPVSYTS
ncbi:protein trachealess-like [Gigantopelta aegis]|uniref:protein trachealess-like n=1 Tax=Gigantopelta aegis TaxID=1735272 RepID=UPI001B88B68A|nr:protein trachealess-like [Gigantopelta aegis]